MYGEGQTSEGQSGIRSQQDDVKEGKTTCGASIQNKDLPSPPGPSGGTCSGVPAGSAAWTSYVLVPIHRSSNGAMS